MCEYVFVQIISLPPERMTNVGEATFAKKLLAEGLRYIYQPKSFLMRPPYRSYRPDFYVPAQRRFYEVMAMWETWCGARRKIAEFRRQYPNVDLAVVDPSGDPLGSRQALRRYTVNRIPNVLLTPALERAKFQRVSLDAVLRQALRDWMAGRWQPDL